MPRACAGRPGAYDRGMRYNLTALVLGLLACDSPGSGPAPFVSCETATSALCARWTPDECGWLAVFVSTEGDSWTDEAGCRLYLLGDGYEARGRGYGCAYDDGTSYAPCLAAAQAMNCEPDVHNTTIDAAFNACSRPLTP